MLGPKLNIGRAIACLATFCIVSYTAAASAQATNDDHSNHNQTPSESTTDLNPADHSQHSGQSIPQAAQTDNNQSANLPDMNHEEMEMEMEPNVTSTRSPHAYSGGFTREEGPYALPVNEQHSLADEEIFTRLMMNRLEYIDADDEGITRYDTQLWIGKTYSRFVMKAEGDLNKNSLEESKTELLWSRATSKFWDTQLGMRFDNGEGPARQWIALGVQGLAPYWFDVHATAFVGESGRTAIGFEAEYEARVTQRLIFKPRVDINIYGKDDKERGIGKGLSDVTLGLRMQYQFTRQFAPYVGIERKQSFGKTADFLGAGVDSQDTRWIAGLRFWY